MICTNCGANSGPSALCRRCTMIAKPPSGNITLGPGAPGDSFDFTISEPPVPPPSKHNPFMEKMRDW